MKNSQTANSGEIERLREQIMAYLKWGPVREWHSSMFDELSQMIYESCRVRLSTATLKRFFGVVQFQGLPSTHTLDTLSTFIGYTNWRDFKTSKATKRRKKLNLNFSRKSYYVTAGFLMALALITILSNTTLDKSVPLENITFSSRPVTITYPNSVIFDFDLAGTQIDDIRIQQYWDPTKTINIRPHQQQATGIYYFPGYFRAKLIINDQSVREHDLFLKSNGWMGMIEYDPVPKYFEIDSINARLSSPGLIRREIMESGDRLVSSFHYINDLGNVSGDSFTLNSTVKFVYDDKWAVCHTTKIYLIGTTSAMIIPFAKVGCSSENNLMLNDLYLSGKEHDLSGFGTDFSTPGRIQIKNRNRNISVYIDERLVYQGTYQESMGKLVGLRYKFVGVGEVKDISLLDQNGTEVGLM